MVAIGSDQGLVLVPTLAGRRAERHRTQGLIRTWDANAANAHDEAGLPALISMENTAAGVWTDTACLSKKNEAFLAKAMLTSSIHQKRFSRRSLPERVTKAAARRSKVRTVGIAHARIVSR